MIIIKNIINMLVMLINVGGRLRRGGCFRLFNRRKGWCDLVFLRFCYILCFFLLMVGLWVVNGFVSAWYKICYKISKISQNKPKTSKQIKPKKIKHSKQKSVKIQFDPSLLFHIIKNRPLLSKLTSNILTTLCIFKLIN